MIDPRRSPARLLCSLLLGIGGCTDGCEGQGAGAGDLAAAECLRDEDCPEGAACVDGRCTLLFLPDGGEALPDGGLVDAAGAAGDGARPLDGPERDGAATAPPLDQDGDEVPDVLDLCPTVADPAQRDEDQDGVGDLCDLCPAVPDHLQRDLDGDRVGDGCDRCPRSPGPGTADGCPPDAGPWLDGDGDGIPDVDDNCPVSDNPDQRDTDGDGVGNRCDNCPALANWDQEDREGDGKGDRCQTFTGWDRDGDRLPDDRDRCPEVWDPQQGDGDADGVGDACDVCPTVADAAQVSAADPGGPGQNLVFCCAADNDLYRVLTAAGVACSRHDRPADAVRAAPEGAGVLILADGYPERPTVVPAAALDEAAFLALVGRR